MPADTETKDVEASVPKSPSEQSLPNIKSAIDWTDVNDKENPENWSEAKKWFHVGYIALQCFVSTFGTSVYTPAVHPVAKEFDVSTIAAILPLTLYTLGLAFGPAISAPISETAGRRVVYLSLFPVSLLFTLGAGLSKSYATLMVCRFFAGTTGSAGLAVGAGSISDMFSPLNRAPVSAVFLLAPFAGPVAGPVTGSFLVQYMTWRWTQWIILMVGAVNLAFGLFTKETYKKIILSRRAKNLGLEGPPNPLARMTPVQRMKFLLTVTIARPVVMLLTEPIVAFLALYTSFTFGTLFCFFAAFPLVFESTSPQIQVYRFSQGESGLVFLGIGVGIMSATIIFILSDRLYYRPRALKEVSEKGKDARALLLPPEKRVISAMIGSVMLPIGLFWFAWTARSDIHWIVPILSLIFFGCGNLLVFFTAVMYQLDSYGPLMGASAMAANGLLRYIFGATFPLFAQQMYRSLGVGWATSLLGFVTILLMPVPWILRRYGPAIRKGSKYASFSAGM